VDFQEEQHGHVTTAELLCYVRDRLRFRAIHRKYSAFTQIEESTFAKNLLLAERVRGVRGCVVECGVWKGGMSAAIAELLGPGRRYFLFDSFQGMPPSGPKDCARAKRWTEAGDDPLYRDNNRASPECARRAMLLSGVQDFTLVEGWFDRTLPGFIPPEPIALLRIDVDWYESTTQCLEYLFPHLADYGIAVIDDYRAWDGCARAVNEFLARHANDEPPVRLWQYGNDVYYLTKYK
jgi:O-methyltransferase